MTGGPQPMERAERMALVQEIADRLLTVYQDRVHAIGLYGSTARGTDGPFSDIEMFCVLNTIGENYSYEWTPGPWKAEVDVMSADILLNQAARVDSRWPLTHDCYSHIHALYDPLSFFAQLHQAVSSQPQEKFTAAIREMIVCAIYEVIGKLRSAQFAGNSAHTRIVVVELAKYGAYLIGLAHQKCYTTSSHMLEESLTMADRPAGYDALCNLVMSGDLRDPNQISQVCEVFWLGVEQWAAEKGIEIEEKRKIPF